MTPDARINKPSLDLWREVLAETVRGARPDLTTRQLAILLTIYADQSPHTVRGLSADLGLPKPAVTRALDALNALGFIRRRRDAADRRNVLIHRTVEGAVFLSEFEHSINVRAHILTERGAAASDG